MLLDQVTVQLTRINCWCGVTFAIPEEAWGNIERRRKEGQSQKLTCPVNGHAMYFTPKNDLQETRDALARERHRREQAQAEATAQRERADRNLRRVRANRAVVTRLKNRIAKGRCVCCAKEFKDVAAHMKRQHPDWNPDKYAQAREAKEATEADTL